MSAVPKQKILPLIAAIAAVTGASTLVLAQINPNSMAYRGAFMKDFTDNWAPASADKLGQLGGNEGIYVNMQDFGIMKGAAKGDPQALIKKMGAKEVDVGAIIFRSGEKLYIVDGKPPK